MLQERSRWRKYISLSTTGEAHPSDAVGSEITSDARELPGQANLALPSDYWRNLHIRCRKCGTPVRMLREPSRLSECFLSTTGEAYPSDAVSIELLSDAANLPAQQSYLFVLLSSHPLPFPSYVQQGLPVRCHEY